MKERHGQWEGGMDSRKSTGSEGEVQTKGERHGQWERVPDSGREARTVGERDMDSGRKARTVSREREARAA